MGMGVLGGFATLASAEGVDNAAVGGHAQNLVFDGNKLTKMTALTEAQVYRCINSNNTAEPKYPEDQAKQMIALKPFVPEYFSSNDCADPKIIGKGDGAVFVSYLTLVNLLHGKEDPHMMDIKLGTSTLTMRGAAKGQWNHDTKAKVDAAKTSAKLGFCVVGGKVEGRKFAYKKPDAPDQPNPENVNDALRVVFEVKGKVQKVAVEHCIEQLDLMIDHFTNVNTFEIRGASIFLVLDHAKGNYDCKLIDLASMDFKDHRDEGFLLGLVELRQRFATFI